MEFKVAGCFGILICPGHALHKKGLLRQIGDNLLASSQERKAVVEPRIKP